MGEAGLAEGGEPIWPPPVFNNEIPVVNKNYEIDESEIHWPLAVDGLNTDLFVGLWNI